MKSKSLLWESLLDYVRASLDPLIWGQDGKLIDRIKDEILLKLNSEIVAVGVIEMQIKDVLIIGSITGRQYLPTSDVDVTVLLTDDVPKDKYIELVKHFNKNVNGWLLTGTMHPVNYYFKYDIDLKTTIGAYSLKTDEWLKPPVDVEPYDPEVRYAEQIEAAKQVAKEIMRSIDELYRDLRDLKELKDLRDGFYNRTYILKQHEIFTTVIELNAILRQVVLRRKEAFEKNGESAQEKEGNIVYKFLERYGYLDKLKKINKAKNDFYSKLSEICMLD